MIRDLDIRYLPFSIRDASGFIWQGKEILDDAVSGHIEGDEIVASHSIRLQRQDFTFVMQAVVRQKAEGLRPVFRKPGKRTGGRDPVDDRWNIGGIYIASKDVAARKRQALCRIPDDIGVPFALCRDEGRDALLNVRKLAPIAIIDGDPQRLTLDSRVR